MLIGSIELVFWIFVDIGKDKIVWLYFLKLRYLL